MAEYICRENTLDVIREMSQRYTDESLAEFAYNIISNIPTADVQPVRRGKWLEIAGYDGWGETIYRCSECKITEWVKSNFCPNCGARMEV